jgi:hypothetical protein
MALRFTAEIADEGDRIRSVPAPALGDATEALGGARRATAQHDCPVRDRDVEAVAGPDSQRAPGLARHDDLVLGADLDA